MRRVLVAAALWWACPSAGAAYKSVPAQTPAHVREIPTLPVLPQLMPPVGAAATQPTAGLSPWQMTRQDWLAAGSPDLGIQWRFGQRAEAPPPWRDTLQSEIAAVNDFMMIFPDPIAAFWDGGPADPAKAEPERQTDFAGSAWWHQHMSHFPGHAERGGEDAREAVIVGRKLGYRDQDILYYLVRNYVIGPHMPDVIRDARLVGWDVEKQVFKGRRIPDKVKKLFPALGSAEIF